ncbi:MAG: beta-propeller fold lactonase family protein [Zoogloea sp.]|uniref:YncE family protein n=1 Tax=Zoogloea sp. TaxID=49181 RepID=UPI0026044A69|nr:beta-propeller fold lactonase family protein [Zoogloea sp.]MDD2988731.1 beta-propeller fold lactonase family protein [Zoogloea sp.]
MRLRLTALLALALLTPALHAETAIVLNSVDESVSFIDTRSYQETGRAPACKEPHHLMAMPDDSAVIVACAVSNELVFFDPHTGREQKRIKNISDPYQLGFSPDKTWFVANSLRLDRVDLYRASDFSLIARIPAEKTPSHMAFDKASQVVFITLQDSNEVLAIDLKTRQPAWKHPVGPTPAGIHMTPDDRYLLVGIMGADYVEVIDWRARRTIKRITTAKGAHNFLPRGDGRHVFVSNRTIKGSISLVDMQTLSLVESYDVPGGPDDMEIRADGKELWATARFARKVQVVNLEQKKISHSIRVGRSPHGVSFINHAPRQ